MMKVTKRDGSQEDVSFDKVTNRLRLLCAMEPQLLGIDLTEIAQKVITRIYNGVNTYELDELAAEQCTQKGVEHINYSDLASRIAISNNQKRTSPSFSETIGILYSNVDVNDKPSPLISEEVFAFVKKNKSKLNSYIDYSRDYNFNYFSLKTLEKAYLMKINEQTEWHSIEKLNIEDKDIISIDGCITEILNRIELFKIKTFYISISYHRSLSSLYSQS